MNRSVLVLNASYEPINICDVKRAVRLIFKGIACAEDESDIVIRSPSVSIRVPLVIRLHYYVHIPHRLVKFSRKNVLLRDKYKCQYCGKSFPPSTLTLDHVIPSSRGGKTCWDNVVTACSQCNHRKGDRTPQEAQMWPIRTPKALSLIYSIHQTRSVDRCHEVWKKYMYH